MNFEELIRALPLIDREAITLALDQLVQEGLVTRFGGRVCFNRAIPNEIMHDVEGSITPSGTIRAVKQ
jgi:DNA-binding HxlR family transcriptional regulator